MITITISAVTNIAINSLLIVVITRTPTLRDDRTTLFILSLVSSDLAFGVCVMASSAIISSSPDIRVDNFVAVFVVVGAWLNVTSLYNLCYVSVCKMVAVVYPLRYLTVVTERRCYVIIVFTWVVCLILAIPLSSIDMTWDSNICFIRRKNVTSTDPDYVVAMETIVSVLPMATMIYANVRMFCVVVRVTHKVSSEQARFSTGSSSLALQQHTLASVMFRSVRSSRNIIVICLAYIVVVVIAIAYESIVFANQKLDSPNFRFVILWLFFNNTSFSSMLYILLHRSVRKAIKKQFSEWIHHHLPGDVCRFW